MKIPTKRALITGVAGFIGSHLAEGLTKDGWTVVGIDNFDPFYPRDLKIKNLDHIGRSPSFQLIEADIRHLPNLLSRVNGEFDAIVHLAAKAGVRPSLDDPQGYQVTNVLGTQNVLELARLRGIRQFVFASSSSVYGLNSNVPWFEEDHDLKPISPYACTKLDGELLGHSYSHLYGIRFLALRLFTVYGPRQRPDLVIRKFAQRMIGGEAVPVFGDGTTSRDYTYVDDIVAGIRAAMVYDRSQYEVINLGNHRTVGMEELLFKLEEVLGLKAEVQWCQEQPGDLRMTWADTSKAKALLGYEPRTEFTDGLRRFAEWLRNDTESGSLVKSSGWIDQISLPSQSAHRRRVLA